MNCEEFRRQLLIDPSCDEPAFREHAGDCSECAGVLEEALRFEQALRTALAAELAPAGETEARISGALPLRVLSFLLAALRWRGSDATVD
jgi:hypothetical protein